MGSFVYKAELVQLKIYMYYSVCVLLTQPACINSSATQSYSYRSSGQPFSPRKATTTVCLGFRFILILWFPLFHADGGGKQWRKTEFPVHSKTISLWISQLLPNLKRKKGAMFTGPVNLKIFKVRYCKKVFKTENFTLSDMVHCSIPGQHPWAQHLVLPWQAILLLQQRIKSCFAYRYWAHCSRVQGKCYDVYESICISRM